MTHENCTTYVSQKNSFTYSSYTQNVSISVPQQLTASQDKMNLTTYLHVCAENCGNISQICSSILVNVTGSSSSSSSNKLPAGAIVGIVCAGVLVLGLAAWWICMKRPKDETYKKLDD